MPRTKPLNSKINIKQLSSGDLVANPVKYVTQRANLTSSAGQTIVTLPFSVDQTVKDAFFIIVDGKLLTEGAGNDYTFTSINSAGLSAQITLSQTLIAGLNIIVCLMGALVQQEPTNSTLAAQIAALSGSGQGGINYITAYSAETSIAGWNRFVDAAGASPIDGTGGSPAAGTTFTQSTSAPLRGTASFLLTKDASNRQGEGVSYDFTIDSTDKASMLAISFDYATGGTFVSGSSSDIQVWIYDVTNAVLIQPSPSTIAQPNGKFKATFQTNSNSTSYRLIFHIATTSAAAYTFKMDNVQVGPQAQVAGVPLTDINSNLVFTTEAFGTISSSNFKTRRVGDSLEVWGYFVSGTVTGASARIVLPGGYTVDTAKMLANKSQTIGDWHALSGANSTQTVNQFGAVIFDNSDGGNNGVGFAFQLTTPLFRNYMGGTSVASSGDGVAFHFLVPITGWSSNVLMSNDADTRVVAATVTGSPQPTGGLTASSTPVVFSVVTKDTHGAFSGSTYTVPVTGWYRVTGTLSNNGTYSLNTADSITIRKNGAVLKERQYNAGGAITFCTKDISSLDFYNAGDTIQLYHLTNAGSPSYSSAAGYSFLTISRESGPAAIAASESITAKYRDSSGQVVTNGVTNFTYGTKVWDSHGIYNAGLFTAPAAGKYLVQASDYSGGTAGWTGSVYKNGSRSDSLMYAPAANKVAIGSVTVDCLAGDTIAVRSDTSMTRGASSADQWVSVTKVAN